jgi:hypothetical protein
MKAITIRTAILTLLLALSVVLYADAGRQQCDALTKKGVQCKNLALPGTIYCRVHSDLGAGAGSGGTPSIAPPHKPLCQFVSKKSGRCGREAMLGTIYCISHLDAHDRERD